jgi:hypothetical protein
MKYMFLDVKFNLQSNGVGGIALTSSVGEKNKRYGVMSVLISMPGVGIFFCGYGQLKCTKSRWDLQDLFSSIDWIYLCQV